MEKKVWNLNLLKIKALNFNFQLEILNNYIMKVLIKLVKHI